RAFVVPGESAPESSIDAPLPRPLEAQPARISTYTANRIVVEVDLQHPGLLVLSEVWYPGWQARDGGRERPIYHVEGVLRGVYLAAGTHTVEFRYAPCSAWLGLALSGSATLGLLGYAAIRFRRRR
ncbi:MAG: YfhO family protein, partial [Anaerolineae bacterium]